ACLAVTVGGQLVGFGLLGRSKRWTYRAAPLLGMEVLYAAASASLALAASWPLFLPGLFIYGAAQSVSYASSLFYSLDYDERRHADVSPDPVADRGEDLVERAPRLRLLDLDGRVAAGDRDAIGLELEGELVEEAALAAKRPDHGARRQRREEASRVEVAGAR